MFGTIAGNETISAALWSEEVLSTIPKLEEHRAQRNSAASLSAVSYFDARCILKNSLRLFICVFALRCGVDYVCVI